MRSVFCGRKRYLRGAIACEVYRDGMNIGSGLYTNMMTTPKGACWGNGSDSSSSIAFKLLFLTTDSELLARQLTPEFVAQVSSKWEGDWVLLEEEIWDWVLTTQIGPK